MDEELRALFEAVGKCQAAFDKAKAELNEAIGAYVNECNKRADKNQAGGPKAFIENEK